MEELPWAPEPVFPLPAWKIRAVAPGREAVLHSRVFGLVWGFVCLVGWLVGFVVVCFELGWVGGFFDYTVAIK